MLKALFFYIHDAATHHISSPTFELQISSLVETFSFQHVNCYFIEDSISFTFPHKSLSSSYFFSQLTNSPILFHIDEQLYQHTEVLIISNDLLFLQQIKPYSLYTIGYMDSSDFLPTTYCFESFEELDYSYFFHIYQRYQKEPITILSTKRTIVRELSSKDLPDLYELFQDKQNTFYLSEPHLTYDDFFTKWNSYIDRIYPLYDFGLWGVFFKDTNTLIGQFGIQNVTIAHSQEIEVGYLLGQQYHRKGIGKEVLQAIFHYVKTELNLNHLVAVIHPDNISSIALARTCGMQLEKTIMLDNRNMLLYSIDINENWISEFSKS